MGRTKKIRCRCYGWIATTRSAKSPWEDVWLRWKGKPGRRTYTAAITLKCRAEVLVDQQYGRELQAEDPDSGFWPTNVAETERMLAALAKETYIVGPDADPTYIYTSANGIDRAEAERMLAFFFRQRHGIGSPQFKWNRLKAGPAVIPLGFGNSDR